MAYSQDLRDRVIDAVLVEGMSRRAAAARYGVSETAAINWVRRVELTGLRTPAKLGGYKPMMLAGHRAFLETVCRDRPDVTLQGLCDRLLAERGVRTYGTVRNSVSGPVYCSREEPILEHDRELRFRLAPFPWRHFPLACDLTQDKIDKLRRRLVGWKMSPDFDGAPQLCV